MIDHGAVLLACRAHARTLEVCATADTFARASTATYTDVNGVVQTAAVDEYRDAHYVNGVLTPLLESAGTNLIVYSQDLANAAWTTTSFAANATTAPDGTATADQVDTAFQLVTMAPSTTYTYSFFIKNGTATLSFATLYHKVSQGAGAQTNVSLLSIAWSGATLTGVTALAGTTATVVTLANGWYRVFGTGTTDPSIGAYQVADVYASGANTHYVWGVQLEAAAAATSYIPTTATAAIRAADSSLYQLAATATGYTRTSGSFLTDGFRVGMEVTPTGFTTTTPAVVTAVTATTMTVDRARAVDASVVAGRTLAVNLPASVAYLNVPHEPTAQTPWVEEQYLPGSAEQWSVTTTGQLEVLPQYALTFYLPTGSDVSAAFGYADAMLDHFAPGTPLTLADGTDLRVRARPAPYPSPLQIVDGAWAALTVTVPLRHITPNSR